MLLGAAIVISVCIAVSYSLRGALCGLGLGLLFLTASGADLRSLAGRLWLVNAFILFIWLVVPFSQPVDIIWSWGWLSVSGKGLWLCLLVTLKANAIFFVFCALVANMPHEMLGSALASLGLPKKLVHLFLFALRFWHLLAEEWQAQFMAARIRAFRPATNRHSYYTLASMLALLLVRANWRARRVHEAMLLRGFNGQLNHCPRCEMGRADLALGLFTLAASLLLSGLA